MSAGRRTIGLDDLGDHLYAGQAPCPWAPLGAQREPDPTEPPRRPSRVAPDWKFKASPTTTATLGRLTNPLPVAPGTCTHPLGCGEPALPDRWSCAKHAADLEARAARIRQ
jgi:hypothetical protein